MHIANVRTYLADYRALTPEDVRRAVATYVTDQGDWSMLVLPARGAGAAAAARKRGEWPTNSADPIAEQRRRRSGASASWNPLPLQRQPFFDDKNRAFWILQSAGWAGYFFLRTLSGIANAMGWLLRHPHRAADRDRLFDHPADGLGLSAG